MAASNPLNATFFAFRKRERGGVLTGASIAFAVLSALLIGGFIALFLGAILDTLRWYGDAITSAAQGSPSGAAPPMALVGLILALFPYLFIFYVLFAAYEAACLRWMVHQEVQGPFGFNLGAPTWRIYGGYWLWLGIQMAVSTATSIVMMIVMGGGMFAAATANPDDPGASVLMLAVLLPLVYLFQYGVLAFISVRFAPAAACSVARRRFAFFDAWKVTQGRFWALLGSFALLYLIYFVLLTIIGLLAAVPIFVSVGMNPAAMESPSTFFAALMNPSNLAFIAIAYGLWLIVGLGFMLASFGVNARAVQAAIEEGKIDGVTPETAKAFE